MIKNGRLGGAANGYDKRGHCVCCIPTVAIWSEREGMESGFQE